MQNCRQTLLPEAPECRTVVNFCLIAPSLPRTLAPSLPRSLAPSILSVPCSLAPSLPQSLAPSLPRTHRSLASSLPPSRAPSLHRSFVSLTPSLLSLAASLPRCFEPSPPRSLAPKPHRPLARSLAPSFPRSFHGKREVVSTLRVPIIDRLTDGPGDRSMSSTPLSAQKARWRNLRQQLDINGLALPDEEWMIGRPGHGHINLVEQPHK